MTIGKGDLFNLYFDYVKDTEPPIIFHRWSLLSAVGAFLGRDIWLPFGASRILPNMYVMLVGSPGSRKSSAIKGVRRILTQTGYSEFAAEKTSKEKYLVDLQGEKHGTEDKPILDFLGGGHGTGSDSEYKRSFIVADEFNEFVGSGNLEFLSMLGSLWDWDDPETPYRSKTKTAKSVEIYQPTISILAGNTHAGFAEAFPVAVLGQGFMSRLILVHSEPSGRKITIPPIPNASLASDILREFSEIRSAVRGGLSLSERARAGLDSIYKTWEDLEDNRFKHYSTRRFTHLLKLCIILAAIGKTSEIGIEQVLFANTLLSWTELSMPKAIGELGRKRSTEASSLIMQMLYEAKKPITIIDFWRQLDKDLEHMTDLARLLQNLQQAGKVQAVKIGSVQGFLPLQRPANKSALLVDFSLLRGFEQK